MALRANLVAFIRGLRPRVGARLRLDLLYKEDAAKPRPYLPPILDTPANQSPRELPSRFTFAPSHRPKADLHFCTVFPPLRNPYSVLWSHLCIVSLHRPLANHTPANHSPRELRSRLLLLSGVAVATSVLADAVRGHFPLLDFLEEVVRIRHAQAIKGRGHILLAPLLDHASIRQPLG